MKRVNTNSVDYRFQLARAKIGRKAPYFATALYRLYPVKVDKIRRLVNTRQGPAIQLMDTFGVTEKGLLLYTDKAVEEFKGAQLEGVLAHEVMHILLEHMSRTRASGYDPALFNIAADLFINDNLTEGGWELPPSGMFPKTFGWEGNLTADEYYYKLRELQNEQREKLDKREKEGSCPQCGGHHPPQDNDQTGQDCQDKGQSGDSGEDEQSQEDGQSGQGEQSSDDQEGCGESSCQPQSPCTKEQPGFIDGVPDITNQESLKDDVFGNCGSGSGQALDNEKDLSAEAREAERSPEEMERLREDVAREMQDHAKRNPGSIPGGLDRWIKDMLKPPVVDWRAKLRRTYRHSVNIRSGYQDTRYGKMHRRQPIYGWGPKSIQLPRAIAFVPKVLVAIDTSGSMSPEDLETALSELDGIIRHTKAEVEVCSCDCEVQASGKVRSWREAAKKLKGGGGTDFVPIFEFASANNKYDVVVVVTDGGGPAPQNRPAGYETIWVEVGHYAMSPCEWGEHVRIPPRDSENNDE